jgi:hypothetical protein
MLEPAEEKAVELVGLELEEALRCGVWVEVGHGRSKELVV